MPAYLITAPNGRKLRISGERPPTEQELGEIFSTFKPKDDLAATQARVGLPNASPAIDMGKRFVGGMARALNPMNLVHAVGDVASSQVNALMEGDPMALLPGGPIAKQMAQASVGRAGEAVRLAGEGDLLAAAGQAGAAIPLVGEMAAQAGQRAADTGDYAGLAGEITGTALAPKIGSGVLRGASKAASRVASSPVTKEALDIAKDAAGAKIRLQNPTAGEAAAAAVAGSVGGPGAAATVYGMLKIPKVIKAIAKGRAARKAISEVKAQSEVLKMSDEALEKEALIQKMDEGTGLPLNEDGTVTVDFGGVKINLDPSRIEPKGGEIKPIPPSRLKPDIPDPVIPEIAPKAPKVDRGRQAKAEFEAKKSDMWNAKTGEPVQMTAEEAKEVVSRQPWNKGKTESVAEAALSKARGDALMKQVDEAISPNAAFEILKKHGIEGKKIPTADARAIVDAVWTKKDSGYRSIEQWMKDRSEKWNAMRHKSGKKGN